MNLTARASMWLMILLFVFAVFGQRESVGAESGYTNPAFADSIAKFSAENASGSIAPGGVVFYGSSTIGMWNLEKFFPGVKAINRGFGGTHFSDCILAATEAVVPLKPRIIVLYNGDNDISSGKSPELVAKHFKQLAALLRKALPNTLLVSIAIKPSPQRWPLYPKMKQVNQIIHDFINGKPGMQQLELGGLLLDSDGHPIKEMFLPDGLHLSEKGYQLWSDAIAPLLK